MLTPDSIKHLRTKPRSVSMHQRCVGFRQCKKLINLATEAGWGGKKPGFNTESAPAYTEFSHINDVLTKGANFSFFKVNM